MADQWHYTCKGKETGPVATAELKRLAATGSLRPTDLVWKDGMADWVRAGSLTGLFPDSAAITARVVSPTPADAAGVPSSSDREDNPENDGTRPDRKNRRNRTGSEDEVDADDSPRRRRSRAPSHSSAGMWIALAVCGGLLLVGIIVAVIVVASGGKAPGVIMTYNVNLQVQGQDIRPINLQAGNRYQFFLKADNQAGDVDMYIMNNKGQDLAIDDGVAADAFIDFTAPYSGMFRIDVFNVGPMPNVATITVTDKGRSPLPANQPIIRKENKQLPAQPPIFNPPVNQPPVKPPPINQPPKITPKKPKNLATVIPGEMFPFLETAVRQNRLADVAITGFKASKNTYRDVFEDGGMLIGLQVGKGENRKMDTVNAIRPIYLTLEGEKMGSWHGPAPAEPMTLKAKEGYVVGGMTIATSLVVDGLSLKFVKLADNRLVSTDTYSSDWVGRQTANRIPVGGQGYFIVGVCGHLNNQNVLSSLGFVAVLDAK
jgi:GYF domain 2